MSDPPSPHSDPNRDPYRGVVIVLLAMALLGTVGAVAGAVALTSPILLDVAVTLGLSSGILIGVAVTQAARERPPKNNEGASSSSVRAEETEPPADTPSPERSHPSEIGGPLRDPGRKIRRRTAAAGVVAITLVLPALPAVPLAPLAAGVAAALCLGAAGLAFTAARYLGDIEPARLPEAPGLCRGARAVAWILVLAALSMGLAWARQQTILRLLHLIVLSVNAAVCYGLLTVRWSEAGGLATFPLDLGVLSLLGSRTNVLASVLDAAERQLGIDLRSTWALTVVRRSVEPLVIGLCLLGWLLTSLTVVGVEQQGLVERLGVPVEGPPLLPGLHLHWPWPVDRVFRIPVQRVQALTVGHEGEEEAGPENVLWAREHAANEYTLLLGNGRDLITVDAAVQFRITDARAWLYHCQNPAEALRAIAYRAVMRSTVNRTLTEALSENVVTLTGQMRAMVQQDADALGLGVDVVAFTVGGMHPPVMVAAAYEAVVSAEIGKVTAAVNAEAFRN
ncbi:MAG TPA: SPFH domain-containing protein, partial [Candidatus Sulfotelmatobacter sp.]|nr:SPFH domain-containing protein [Candidatus Sulfotelmatobacter sp.]